MGGVALRALTAACTWTSSCPSAKMPAELLNELRCGLRMLKQALATTTPREVRVEHCAPVLIFTDGSHGPEYSGFGAVLLDPSSGAAEAFGQVLEEPQVRAIQEGTGSTQIIGQMESLPVLLALRR